MSSKRQAEVSALPFIPAGASLGALRQAAAECRGCSLFQNATQTVFGEGPVAARVVMVGEQPGNDEDLEGHPFVGPAGRVLDQALEAAGIDRAEVYVTNVVKHFKWTPRGKRRIHAKPNTGEIRACLPWLEKEIEIVRPEVLVCLGATAAQALLGRDFKVTTMGGRPVPTTLADHAVATVHPSSILRQPTPEDRKRAMEEFTSHLRVVAQLLSGRPRR